VNALMQSSDIRQQFAAVVCSTGTLGMFGHPAHSAHGNKGEPKERDYCRSRRLASPTRRLHAREVSSSLEDRRWCRAEVPKSNKAAIRVRRVAGCAGGSFTVGNADGINATYWQLLYRADGLAMPGARASSPGRSPGVSSPEARMSVLLPGGCPCDAVRFEIAEVFDAGHCHCSRCREQTGAPVFACVHVPSAAFNLRGGELVAEPWERLGQGMICASCRGVFTSIWATETCCPLASAA
jgi:hypothetical protein